MWVRVTVVTAVLLLTAGASGGLAAVSWRRHGRGSRALAVMFAAAAVWCAGDAVEYGATALSVHRLGAQVGMLGSTVFPVAALVFALQYAGFGEWVTERSVAAMSVVPTVTVVLTATGAWHDLLWRYTGTVSYAPVTTAEVVRGPWWVIHMTYAYAVTAAAFGIIVLFYLRSRGVYRRQAALMLLGGVVPLSVNLLWLVGASPVPGADLSSVTLVVSTAIFAVALFGYGLLDLAPVPSHELVAELRDGVVAVDQDGRVVDANPVARRILGDGGGIVGRSVAELLPRYGEVRETGAADDVVLAVDGEDRHFDVRSSPLSAGMADGRTLLLRDVTERRRVERRYVSFIEHASDLVHVLEPDGTMRYVSPPVESVLGYEPEELVGDSIFEYVAPDDHEPVVAALERLVADPDAQVRVECEVRTVDGGTRVLEARGRNLLDDPDVEGLVVNSRDVTRRKRRERALQRQNEQLEEFASVISHDLRNPLAVARGYAGVLESEYDDDRVEKLVNAHERMDELLDDLLTLAKEGRSVDGVEAVDLAEAAHMAWATVETGDATLTVEADGAVLADGSRLRQLLENLFSNAVEHGSAGSQNAERSGDAVEHGSTSPRQAGDAVEHGSAGSQNGAPDDPASSPVTGGLTVTVGDIHEASGMAAADATSARPDGGDRIGFYVADDGTGVPEAIREEVFDVSVSGAADGTGFGLSIVRSIAEAHGWEVTLAESESGGARFEFTDVEAPDGG